MRVAKRTDGYGNVRNRAAIPAGLLALAMLAALGCPCAGQEVAQFFRRNCASCHTIGGGRLTGPDLKDVEKRQKREWLLRFILDPQAMVHSGDPYAKKLVEEARSVIMPRVQGLTPELAEALLDLIAAESKLEKSHFAGLTITDEPFRPEQIERGRDYFVGKRPLAAGAPPCVSCHTVSGLGLFGGGRLGPDLSRVYEKLQGRRGLASWLMAPATPTMKLVFDSQPLQTESEVVELVAFLEDVAKRGGQNSVPSGSLALFLVGLVGAVAALVGADSAWRWRLRSVRRVLVDRAKRRSLAAAKR